MIMYEDQYVRWIEAQGVGKKDRVPRRGSSSEGQSL